MRASDVYLAATILSGVLFLVATARHDWLACVGFALGAMGFKAAARLQVRDEAR